MRDGQDLTASSGGSKPGAYDASYHRHPGGRDVRRRKHRRTGSCPAIVVAIMCIVVTPVFAQGGEGRCFFLCAPDVKIEPTLTFEPIFRRPTVEELEDGDVVGTGQPETETVFELILAVGIPTQIPRVGFTVETIFIPSGDASANPFTGATADELGRPTLRGQRDRGRARVEPWSARTGTDRWLDSSPTSMSLTRSAPPSGPAIQVPTPTKLNFEWDTAFLAFSWLPEGHWLRHVEVEGSLDYVATGIPRRDDVIDGRERFLDDDSPWSFSLVLVVPLAPLAP